jgi:hypothetical protein
MPASGREAGQRREKQAVGLRHTLRRELTGAWRSVRYDLDHHRAAKLADAFTEEFEPVAETERSRVVPLAGVALLLAGGAAGAFLAISGGLAALGTDDPPLAGDRPEAVVSAGPGGYPRAGATPTARRAAPRHRSTRRSPAPAGPNAELAGSPAPAGPPPGGTPGGTPEGSPVPPSHAPGSSASPSAAPSASPTPATGYTSGAPGTGR